VRCANEFVPDPAPAPLATRALSSRRPETNFIGVDRIISPKLLSDAEVAVANARLPPFAYLWRLVVNFPYAYTSFVCRQA
jgi:hypothetical protein